MQEGAKEEGGTPLSPLEDIRREINLSAFVAAKCWERGEQRAGQEMAGSGQGQGGGRKSHGPWS